MPDPSPRTAEIRTASMWDGKPRLTDAEIEQSASTTCADHTDSPSGYIQASYWADEMLKTHKQLLCGQCLRWAIWVPLDADEVARLAVEEAERAERQRRREEAREAARRAAAQRHHESVWPAREAHDAARAVADRVREEAYAVADAVLADAETVAMDAYRVELARIDAEYPQEPEGAEPVCGEDWCQGPDDDDDLDEEFDDDE